MTDRSGRGPSVTLNWPGFGKGAPPHLPRGSYQGVLTGAFNPVVDAFGDLTKAVWMPWVGKHLEPDEGRGWNLLRPGAERVLHRLLGQTATVQCGRLVAGYELGHRVGEFGAAGSTQRGQDRGSARLTIERKTPNRHGADGADSSPTMLMVGWAS